MENTKIVSREDNRRQINFDFSSSIYRVAQKK